MLKDITLCWMLFYQILKKKLKIVQSHHLLPSKRPTIWISGMSKNQIVTLQQKDDISTIFNDIFCKYLLQNFTKKCEPSHIHKKTDSKCIYFHRIHLQDIQHVMLTIYIMIMLLPIFARSLWQKINDLKAILPGKGYSFNNI